jgi:hypothetical protein
VCVSRTGSNGLLTDIWKTELPRYGMEDVGARGTYDPLF